MLETVLLKFGLDISDCLIHPVGNGLINQTWKINHNNREYILQKVNTDVFKNPKIIDENLGQLRSFLEQHFPDYIFVAPLKAPNGRTLVETEEGSFRIFDFVKDSITLNTAENAQQAYEAAKQFGKFSRLLSGFDANTLHPTIPDFHNLQLRYNQFKTALESANAERLANAAEAIAAIEKNSDILQQYQDILSQKLQVPLRVIHHDTKISNVLFDQDGKGLCVIDLDTVMPGYYISDIGDMMRTYLSPVSEESVEFDKVEIRKVFFMAIYKGYMSEMAEILSSIEKDLFIYSGKFIIYMQAVRFLTDYLNNDVYYGARYEEHNLNRAKNQVKLLEEYMQHNKELNLMIEQISDLTKIS